MNRATLPPSARRPLHRLSSRPPSTCRSRKKWARSAWPRPTAKTIQVANAHKLREIGMREAQREQAVRVAQLEKEQKVGEQTASYEREAQVKDAERAMRIATADAN